MLKNKTVTVPFLPFFYLKRATFYCFIVSLFWTISLVSMAYGGVEDLRQLAFKGLKFYEPLTFEITEEDTVEELKRSIGNVEIAREEQWKHITGVSWHLRPKMKWGIVESHFGAWTVFLAKHNFIEISSVEFPGYGRRDTMKYYFVFWKDKLRPYIKGVGYESGPYDPYSRRYVVHLGKHKLKSIVHEHKTKTSYYFEFSYIIEPLFPGLPSLGPLIGHATVLYDEVTGRWYFGGGHLLKEEEINKIYSYGEWLSRNYGKQEPPIVKHYPLGTTIPPSRGESPKEPMVSEPQPKQQVSSSEIDKIRRNIVERYRMLASSVPQYLPLKEGGPLGLIWMGFAARKKLEAYDEVYSAAIAFHNYATRALDYAGESLRENKVELAKKYIEKSNEFQQRVNECILVANEAYRTGVVSAYKASKVTIEIAGTAASVAIPKLDLVISGYFLAMDYGMDKALYGEDKARRNTVIRALVTVAYRLTPFEKMVKEEIGSSQAEAMLRSILNNPEYSEKVTEILAKEGLWYAKHITKDTIIKIADEVSSFNGKPIGAMRE